MFLSLDMSLLGSFFSSTHRCLLINSLAPLGVPGLIPGLRDTNINHHTLQVTTVQSRKYSDGSLCQMGGTYCTEPPSCPGGEREGGWLHGLRNVSGSPWRSVSFAICVNYREAVQGGRNTMCKDAGLWEKQCIRRPQRVWHSWRIVQEQRDGPNQWQGRK